MKLKTICKFMLIILAFIYLLAPLAPEKLNVVISFIGVIILLTAIPMMGKTHKVPTMVFLIVGCTIMFYNRQPIEVWIAGINSMINIAAIITVLQLFVIPIFLGDYNKYFEYLLLIKIKSERYLFLFTSLIAHLFSSFLMFGTIPVMLSLLGDVLKRNVTDYERFISAALIRSYALAIFWAPGAISILLIMQATGVHWEQMFIPGIIMSIIGLTTSVLYEGALRLSPAKMRNEDLVTQIRSEGITEKNAWRKVSHIFLVVIGLIFFILVYERMFVSSSSHRIMLSGLTVAVIWMLLYLKHPQLGEAFKGYWQDGVSKAIDLSALFVSMGIFAKAVEVSGILDYFQSWLLTFNNDYAFLLLIAIQLIIVLLSLIGLHPFISLVMLGKILSSLHLPFPVLMLAFSLMLGSVIAYLLSPFAGMVLTLSTYINRPPMQISLKWNGYYGLILFVEGVVFLYIMSIII